MAIGILLGNFVPSTGPALQQSTFVGVSVPIAVGLLVMMYPILCKVRYETVRQQCPSAPRPLHYLSLTLSFASSTSSSNLPTSGNK